MTALRRFSAVSAGSSRKKLYETYNNKIDWIMLREIISITGKPGLYRILSQGRGNLIVEDLGNGHRFPVHARDKVVSLGDIAMYTESGDTPLGEILEKVKARHEGGKIDMTGFADGKSLHDEFAIIVEDYDRDRVRDRDIRKLFTWYNILLDAGFTEFVEKQTEAGAEEADGKTDEKE